MVLGEALVGEESMLVDAARRFPGDPDGRRAIGLAWFCPVLAEAIAECGGGCTRRAAADVEEDAIAFAEA